MSIISNTKQEEQLNIDNKAINNIKSLAIDMISCAKSGHPGIALSSAPLLYTLYTRHMIFNKNNDMWIDRDRFVMSAGHGSALLYSMLFMCGFLKLEDLKNFRKLNSLTPGHPEYNVTPGVDCSTGPLGQGFATAVGMAIAEKYQNNRYKKIKSIIDHYTYVLCSDGDLMEGISSEAASLAGSLQLGKLIVLYDSNNISLDGSTKNVFDENVLEKFKAMNWDVYSIKDGNNITEIDNAIKKAKLVTDKPSLIEVKTILGLGSKHENTSLVHGKPLTEDDITQLKKKLGMRDVLFTVYEDVFNHINNTINRRNEEEIKSWNNLYQKYYEKSTSIIRKELDKLINNDLSISLDNLLFEKEDNLNDYSRSISNILLNRISDNNLIMGGSADLATSTKTYLNKEKDFNNNVFGKNILFGVREHTMGAVLNGICLLGIRCFGSTFLTFSDYMKPSIRLSALMKLPVVYIFTHDSISVGEDGPTHQPIEQLIGLRSIPNLTVYRPYDANEILGAYKSAFNNLEGPSVIILSKEKTNISKLTKMNEVDKGAYIIKKFDNQKGFIIATGKEVELAIEISKRLKEIGIEAGVVSMPSHERYFKQPKSYQNKILPKEKRIVIEYGSPYSWYKFVRSNKYIFGINHFGKSGSKNDLLNDFHLNTDEIYNVAKKYFK